jgi:hypothetical protein
MNTELLEQCAATIPSAPDAGTPKYLFVSTSLTTWATANPEQFARDFQIDDTVYRRLDPEYYSWLRSRMVVAKQAASAGHLPPAAFEELRVRFNGVHEWAVEHLGAPRLVAAARAYRSGDYKPPIAEDDSPRVPVPPLRKAGDENLSAVMLLVDAISEQALSLGWERERLHGLGSSGIFDPRRGLVCFLKSGDQIGEVTRESIEIIGPPPNGSRLRFYNPDVDQPWIRRAALCPA